MRASTCAAGLAVATLGAGGAAASCTFLVQFHDLPGYGCEGGACGADGAEDVSIDVAADHAGPTGDAYAPCGALASGYYCGGDGLHGYAGSTDDLVYCLDGGIGTATHCDGGCLPLPAPFPDACNPCPGVADGVYCGRDLVGFPADDADFLIQCQTSNVVQSVACAHGCDSSGKASSCFP